MDAIKAVLDYLWNIKFIKGHRTIVAQIALATLAAYQGLATSEQLIASGVDLPNLNAAVYIFLSGYLAAKVAQFSREHEAPPLP